MKVFNFLLVLTVTFNYCYANNQESTDDGNTVTFSSSKQIEKLCENLSHLKMKCFRNPSELSADDLSQVFQKEEMQQSGERSLYCAARLLYIKNVSLTFSHLGDGTSKVIEDITKLVMQHNDLLATDCTSVLDFFKSKLLSSFRNSFNNYIFAAFSNFFDGCNGFEALLNIFQEQNPYDKFINEVIKFDSSGKYHLIDPNNIKFGDPFIKFVESLLNWLKLELIKKEIDFYLYMLSNVIDNWANWIGIDISTEKIKNYYFSSDPDLKTSLETLKKDCESFQKILIGCKNEEQTFEAFESIAKRLKLLPDDQSFKRSDDKKKYSAYEKFASWLYAFKNLSFSTRKSYLSFAESIESFQNSFRENHSRSSKAQSDEKQSELNTILDLNLKYSVFSSKLHVLYNTYRLNAARFYLSNVSSKFLVTKVEKIFEKYQKLTIGSDIDDIDKRNNNSPVCDEFQKLLDEFVSSKIIDVSDDLRKECDEKFKFVSDHLIPLEKPTVLHFALITDGSIDADDLNVLRNRITNFKTEEFNKVSFDLDISNPQEQDKADHKCPEA